LFMQNAYINSILPFQTQLTKNYNEKNGNQKVLIEQYFSS